MAQYINMVGKPGGGPYPVLPIGNRIALFIQTWSSPKPFGPLTVYHAPEVTGLAVKIMHAQMPSKYPLTYTTTTHDFMTSTDVHTSVWAMQHSETGSTGTNCRSCLGGYLDTLLWLVDHPWAGRFAFQPCAPVGRGEGRLASTVWKPILTEGTV